MNKILIPNVTGITNFGDQLILYGLLNVLQNTNSKLNLVVQSTYPELYKDKYGVLVKPSLFNYLIISKKDVFNRVVRFTEFIILLLFLKYLDNRIPIFIQNRINNRELYLILKDYKNSDLIVFIGGGYLRTKKGISQNLNLLFQLFMFTTANLIGKQSIVAPISYGPFAYSYQALISSWFLKKCDMVSFREKYSYKLAKDYGIKKRILSIDHALLIDNLNYIGKKNNNNNKSLLVGFTIRPWLGFNDQNKLEMSYVEGLRNIYKKGDVDFLPIIHVNSPDFPCDSDISAINNVSKQLKKSGIVSKDPVIMDSLSKAREVYSKLDFLIGMRMHSNIMAASLHVPFVAVSYEYKTEGIMEQLGLSKYCTKSKNVDGDNVSDLIIKGFNDREKIREILSLRLPIMQKKEKIVWRGIFHKFLSRV